MTRYWFVLMLPIAVGCGGDSRNGSGVVNFYNWADYIDEQTLPAFEEETGISVNYDVSDSNATLEAKLLTGHTGYDVVVSTASYLARQLKAGLFQPIDKTKLPNLANIDRSVLSKLTLADPGNRYAIPYAWGVNGLGMNVEQVERRIPDMPANSWALMFDPRNASRLAECGITLVDEAEDVVEAALIYLGYPGSDDFDHLKEAFAMLAEIRPYIRYFDSTQHIDDLANGEICLSFLWPGDVSQAADRAKGRLRLKAVLPKEGSVMWVDYLAIPVDAPHPGNAHKLINYLLRPEVAAGLTNSTYYASGNQAASEMVSPAIKEDPAIYPSEEMVNKFVPAPARSPDYVRQRNRLWTDLKANKLR